MDKMKLKLNKKTHTYTKGDLRYVSVSTFIKKFFNGFDEKAIAKKMVWAAKARGEKKTVRSILAEWKAKRDRGTRIHKELEEYILGNLEFEQLSFPSQLATNEVEMLCVDKNSVPELMVCDDELLLAGTIDLAIFDDNVFTLVDWKTNAKLTKFGYEKSPIKMMHDVEDCNFTHYVLQLSLYAYLLERKGFTYHSLIIAHVQEDKTELIEVPYMKDKIEAMIKEAKTWK